MFAPRSGVCASPQDLFEQHDNGPLFSQHFREEGLGKVLSAFYGGVNMHNVLSEVNIKDNDCPQAAAGLLVSPRNSGVITSTGKSGTVFAIVDVENEKSTDATKLLVGPVQGLWARMKCLSCFGLCSCRFVKSVRATLMTALLLLAFVVAHGESMMFVLLFLARLAVTKALQVT